jgi:hypothetical protein
MTKQIVHLIRNEQIVAMRRYRFISYKGLTAKHSVSFWKYQYKGSLGRMGTPNELGNLKGLGLHGIPNDSCLMEHIDFLLKYLGRCIWPP